jgi:hypothetical protein
MVTHMNRTGATPPDTADYEWTAQEVAELFKAACSKRQGVAFMLTEDEIVPVGLLAPGPEKVMAWRSRYCTKIERRALMMWSVADAWKPRGWTIRGFIRDMGWPESVSTYSRAYPRALDKIAECLKRDGVPKFRL